MGSEKDDQANEEPTIPRRAFFPTAVANFGSGAAAGATVGVVAGATLGSKLSEDFSRSQHRKILQESLDFAVGGSYDNHPYVARLIENGANVDGNVEYPGDVVPDSPIIVAARHGHARIVKLLLQEGAKVDAVNLPGQTALHAAIQHAITEIEAEKTSLVNSTSRPSGWKNKENQWQDTIKQLTQAGINKDAASKSGKTAIQLLLDHAYTHYTEIKDTPKDKQENADFLKQVKILKYFSDAADYLTYKQKIHNTEEYDGKLQEMKSFVVEHQVVEQLPIGEVNIVDTIRPESAEAKAVQ